MDARTWTIKRWLAPSLVVAATAMAFLPTLENGFLAWDDATNFLKNPHYRGLGWQQLRWMFTTFLLGPYQPLSWVTLGLDYLIWGMNPFGYHLTNVILHAANALVFYFLARRLLSIALAASREELSLQIGASLAALLFALHPLRVESVAWVTERRDVLSGLFFLLAIRCYLNMAQAATASAYKKWLSVTLMLYVLSLLSKATAVTLPVVLLVLDVYPLKRIEGAIRGWFDGTTRKVWLEKIPFVLLAALAGWVALLGQYDVAAARSLAQTGVAQRMAQAAYGLLFYLRKTLAPIGMSPLYQLPEKFDPLDWPYLASAIAVIGITVTLIVLRRRWPAGLALWISYVALIAPVSGIVQVGPQLVADRYSYLSCLGWALLAGGGVVYLQSYGRTKGRIFAGATAATAVFVIGALFFLTWKQTQVWHDEETLWNHAVSLDPGSSFARSQLGDALAARGAFDEAISRYRSALSIRPGYGHARNNLGAALIAQGRFEEAVEQYRQALRYEPEAADIHFNLATALARLNRHDEAIAEFRKTLEIDSEAADAHYNLAQILDRRGEFDGAMDHYLRAARGNPANAGAYLGVGVILANRGQLDTAIEYFRRALGVRPQFPEAHESLARALALQGKTAEAMRHYQEARRNLNSAQ